MTNTEKLNEIIESSGLKINFICHQMGMTREAFRQKRNNVSAFTVPEVDRLCKILGIKNLKLIHQIFFAKECGKCSKGE